MIRNTRSIELCEKEILVREEECRPGDLLSVNS